MRLKTLKTTTTATCAGHPKLSLAPSSHTAFGQGLSIRSTRFKQLPTISNCMPLVLASTARSGVCSTYRWRHPNKHKQQLEGQRSSAAPCRSGLSAFTHGTDPAWRCKQCNPPIPLHMLFSCFSHYFTPFLTLFTSPLLWPLPPAFYLRPTPRRTIALQIRDKMEPKQGGQRPRL